MLYRYDTIIGSNHSTAFSIHSIIYTSHSPQPTSSLQFQDHIPLFSACCVAHLWNKLPPTLRVPYQSAASSSPSCSPSSCFDISHDVFDFRLKTVLFPSGSLWNLATRRLAVTCFGSVGECGKLSLSSLILGAL